MNDGKTDGVIMFDANEAKARVARVNPKNHPRYSPNLWRFLRARQEYASIGNVYADQDEILWLGYADEEGWFYGVRLMEILCNGSKATTAAYPPSAARALRVVAGFWAAYEAYGRCAVDPAHQVGFIGDETRWEYNDAGNQRSCAWCGQHHQTRRIKTMVRQMEAWEANSITSATDQPYSSRRDSSDEQGTEGKRQRDQQDQAQALVMARKPSYGVLRALRKIASGRNPTEGFDGRSDWGGWVQTARAIRRHNLVDWDGDEPALTAAGEAVLAKWP